MALKKNAKRNTFNRKICCTENRQFASLISQIKSSIWLKFAVLQSSGHLHFCYNTICSWWWGWRKHRLCLFGTSAVSRSKCQKSRWLTFNQIHRTTVSASVLFAVEWWQLAKAKNKRHEQYSTRCKQTVVTEQTKNL